MTRALILTAMFLTAAGYIAHAEQSEPIPLRLTLSAFPMELPGWRGRQEPPLDDAVLKVLGVNDYLTRAYFTKTTAAGLYVGFWNSQRQGDTIHSPLNCLPGSGWEPLSKRAMPIAIAAAGATGPRTIEVNRYVVQKGIDRQMIIYWYQSHGRVVASEYLSKFFLVKDAITMNRTDAALVRVIVPIGHDAGGGEATAEQSAVEFVRILFPVLTNYLPA
jgi:EpsI family protein